ncbi:MAG: hypothetical protein R3F59_12430 [Myxococcota bacterium]
MRHGEVHHVRHAVDVDAARRHVGGDEDRAGAAPEGVERLVALGLGAVGVQARRLAAHAADLAGEAVGVALALSRTR